VALTPSGTPIVVAGVPAPTQPPTLSPEMAQLLTAALNQVPPGALKQILTKNWGYLVALAVPLLLTTWTNLQQIWEGPTQLAEVEARYDADHKRLEALAEDVAALAKTSAAAHKEIQEQLERVLWSLGPRAPLPASQPTRQ
jgi:hypothetical protein